MRMKLLRLFDRSGNDEAGLKMKNKGINVLKRLSSLTTRPEEDLDATHNDYSRRRSSLYEVIEFTNSRASFEDQFNAIQASKLPRALVLVGFVETSTRHDIYALAKLLEKFDWKKLTLIDSVPTSTCRRWQYKKDNILHHIRDVCNEHSITLVLDHGMELNCDEVPFHQAMGGLRQVESDPITRLQLKGHFNAEQTDTVLDEIMHILRQEDRDWDQIQIDIAFDTADSSQDHYQRWQKTLDYYRLLFSLMQQQYGAPITMATPMKSSAGCICTSYS